MLQVYDRNHNKIAGLTKYKDLCIESVLSTGDKTLSFSYPKNLADIIEYEGYVRTKTAEFVVKELNKKGTYIDVKCNLNLDDLEGKPWDRFDSTEQTITDCLNLALAGTGWTIGTCTVTKKRTVRKTACNSLDIIQEAKKTYICEIEFDTINKKLNIAETLGSDKGAYFIEQLNLKELETQGNSYDFYTKIEAHGKGDLTVTLENHQYSNKVKTLYWKDERYTDIESLTEDATYKLNELSKPYVAYAATVLDLANASIKYKEILAYSLGDTITLVSKSNNVKEKQRIVKITEYPEEPTKNTVELGNKALRFEDIQKQQQDTTDTVNNITSDDGTVSEDALKVPVEHLTINKVDMQSFNAVSGRVGTLEMTIANITTANIVDASITTAKIQDASITNAKIANASISTAQIQTAAITTAVIQDGAITNAKIGQAEIDGTKIKNATIGTANIALGSITTALIGVSAIGTTQIADGSITDAKIVELSANKLTAGVIDAQDITVINLNAANITVGTINGAQITPGAIDTTNLSTSVNLAITTAQSDATKAQSTADSKNRIYYQTTVPAGTDYKVNDLWFDTDDGNKIYAWNGTSWVANQFGASSLQNGVIDSTKLTTTINNTINSAADNANSALNTATAAQTTANGKNAVYYASSCPSGGTYKTNDLWFNTADSNKISYWNGSTWVLSTLGSNAIADNAINAAKIAANTITVNQIADNAISTAKLASNAVDSTKLATAVNTAISSAQNTASSAQTTANGKNAVFYSGTAPTATKVNDVWFNTSNGNQISYWNGASWLLSQLGTNAIASLSITNALIADGTIQNAKIGNLDAGKITSGYIDANRIGADTITASHIVAGAIGTTELAANAVTAAKILANTITANQIQAGTITTNEIKANTITAGNIAANTITSNEIKANTITAAQMQAGTITATSGIIADATITNEKIADSTIQSAKIANLDAAKITSGYIDANRIQAGTITADKVLIGDFTNLCSNPTFENGSTNTWSGLSGAQSGNSNSPTKYYAVQNVRDVTYGQWVHVQPGDQFYLSTFCWCNSYAHPFGIGFFVEDKNHTNRGYYIVVYNTDGATKTISGTYTVPASGVSYIKLWTQINATTAFENWYFTNVTCQKVTPGVLIQNGGITADKIAANTITAGSAIIADGAITNAKIADATIDSAKIANLNAGKITAGTLSVTRLEIVGTTNSIVYAMNNSNGLSSTDVNSLNAGVITPRTITADRIVAGAVTANEIASKTITANNIVSGTITGSEIAASTITATNIAANTITVNKVSSDFASSLDLSSNNSLSLKVTSAVNNVQVGVRNLIQNGSAKLGTQYWSGVSYLTSGWFAKDNPTTNKNYLCSSEIAVQPNTTYTIQFIAALNSNTPYTSYDCRFLGRKATQTIGYWSYVHVAANGATNTEMTKTTYTFTTAADEVAGFIRFDNNGSKTSGTAAILYVISVKMEYGTRATDYSDAPEDTQQLISTTDSNAQSYANTAKATAISTASSDATTKANNAQSAAIAAATNANKWLCKRYNISGKGTTVIDYSTIAGYNPVQTTLVNDTLLNNASTGTTIWGASYDNYVGYATTNVCVNSATNLAINLFTDDNGAIFVNGIRIQGTTSTVTTYIILPLVAGWNKIEVMWGEGVGGDGFYFPSGRLSQDPNITAMQCTIGDICEAGITILQNQITSKVNVNGIISAINQTAETISINASKISLEGLVTANSNFKIKTDGSIEAINGTFTGNIKGSTITGSTLSITSSDGCALSIDASGLTLDASTTSDIFGHQGGKLQIGTTGSILDPMFSPITYTTKAGDILSVPLADNVSKFRFYLNVSGSSYLEITTLYGAFGLSAWVSDRKLKKNINSSEMGGIEILKKFKHRQFDWKANDFNHVDCGYIAQELAEINKDFVTIIQQRDGNGKLTGESTYQINEATVIPAISKALQELIARVEKLEEMVNKYEQ